MFRKSKIEPVEKVKIVERYLAGEIGIQQAGKELGVDHHSIRNWISIYQYDGPTGLLNQPKNKSYSKDLKISAINDYLNGEGSLQDICTKYGIRSHRQLSDWIKVYNSGGILKTSTGGAYMKKAKNTTLDERLKIVTDCLANDKNYGAMALKYDCSYQQVRNWVIRYEKMGRAGRGRVPAAPVHIDSPSRRHPPARARQVFCPWATPWLPLRGSCRPQATEGENFISTRNFTPMARFSPPPGGGRECVTHP